MVYFKSHSPAIVLTFFHNFLKKIGVQYTIDKNVVTITCDEHELSLITLLEAIAPLSVFASLVVTTHLHAFKQVSSMEIAFPLKNSNEKLNKIQGFLRELNYNPTPSENGRGILIKDNAYPLPFNEIIDDVLLEETGICLVTATYHETISVVQNDFDLDALLDQISSKGIDSLTPNERQALDDYSSKFNEEKV